MNADNFGNPEMGQPNDTVGQDVQADIQEDASSNWESQAKYFQSEKDKLQVENQKLKQYEEVGKFLESRPDIVQTIQEQASGQPQQPSNDFKPDDFDPWEAYNDPSSESYKYRMAEMQQTINNAVGQATEGIRQQTGRTALETQLSEQGMTRQDIDSFMDFANTHPSEYGLENVIKMWKSVSQAPGQENGKPLDQVRNVQSQPQSGGVLQGQRPQTPKTDTDVAWQEIMGAGDKNVF